MNDKCTVWTYVDGACYLKNENTILIQNNDRTTGEANCLGKGDYNLIVSNILEPEIIFNTCLQTFILFYLQFNVIISCLRLCHARF